jgi:hypothetical protein
MCDDKATEENLKKVQQFVEWFKELTGKDMEYSVRAQRITLHNDEFCDETEDSYECNCDDNGGDDDCEFCKKQNRNEKNSQLFLKVVRDVIEIPPENHSFGIHLIDWKKVGQVCDIAFENGEFKCTNKKSGKGISFNLHYKPLYCRKFIYSVGPFWMDSDNYGSSDSITWMDSFICGAFEHHYSLLVSYILFYVSNHVSSNKVCFLEKVFEIGVLKCTATSITMAGCHFIYTFYKIDESAFDSLYKDVCKVYEKAMAEKIQAMEESLKGDQDQLLQQQEENRNTSVKLEKMIADSTAKVAEKRAAMEILQTNLKKIKH